MAKGEDITTKFKVDISDLKKGITEANNQIKLANSEFKKASAGMDDWAKSSEGLKAKLTQLKSVLEAQNSKLKSYQEQLKTAQRYEKEAATNVENLRKALDKAKSTYGANSTEVKKLEKELSAAEKTEASMKKQVSDLTVTMNNQEATVKSTEKEMSNLTTSLKDVEKAEKLAAKNGTTVEEELKKIEKQADKTESKTGKLAKTLSKALVAGAVAAAAGLIALGKSAISAYADYEQLVGGVDTLFKDSSKKVQEYAANAYKTSGLSANEYMRTVTSFSASLLQSLGGDTAKAADVADMALTDMADNANKMGTAMGSIQDAYQGFAKQNYTMLDNLKLGYGGTKTEMERLLADAEKISGVKYDISNLNDVYQAIHVIQGELGITGTTALEASTTIQGSAAAMKSAWSNLMTGLADDNADMEVLISNFIDSVGTFASNLIPRIAEVMSSIGAIIREHLPEIATQISTWVSGLLDDLIAGLPDGFKELATAIKDGLGVALDVVKELFKWIIDNGDIVISLLAGIAAGFLALKVASIIQAVTTALQGMTVAQWLLNAAMNANPIGLIALAIGALIAAIALLILNWDKVKEAASKCWEAIKNAWSVASEWFNTTIIEPIKNFFSGMWETITGFFTTAWEGIKTVWTTVAQWFSANVIEPIKTFFQPLVDWFTQLFQSISDFIKSVFEVVAELAKGCVEAVKLIWGVVSEWFNTNIIQPIKKFFTDLWNAIKTGASNAWNAIKNVWNVVSNWFNDTIIKPVSNFFTTMWNKLKTGASNAWTGIKSVFSPVVNWFKNQFTKAWTAVKNVFSTGGKIFDGIKEGIASTFKTVVNGIIRGINKVIAVPFNAINKALNKIRSINIAGATPFSGLPTISVPQIPTLATGIAKAKKGHQYLLEGKNDEAVIPLHKNAPWLKALAGSLLDELKTDSLGGNALSMGANGVRSNVNNFTQIINAPKQPSRIELYRQTRNLLELKGGV